MCRFWWCVNLNHTDALVWATPTCQFRSCSLHQLGPHPYCRSWLDIGTVGGVWVYECLVIEVFDQALECLCTYTVGVKIKFPLSHFKDFLKSVWKTINTLFFFFFFFLQLLLGLFSLATFPRGRTLLAHFFRYCGNKFLPDV